MNIGNNFAWHAVDTEPSGWSILAFSIAMASVLGTAFDTLVFIGVLVSQNGWALMPFLLTAPFVGGAALLFAFLPALFLLRFDKSKLPRLTLLAAGGTVVVLLAEAWVLSTVQISGC